MKKENPIYQKILDFLENQPCPRSTNYIAGEGIWPEQYFHKFENAIVVPGKNTVSSAYYYLKNLEKQGKVKQVYRGAWSIVKSETILDRYPKEINPNCYRKLEITDVDSAQIKNLTEEEFVNGVPGYFYIHSETGELRFKP